MSHWGIRKGTLRVAAMLPHPTGTPMAGGLCWVTRGAEGWRGSTPRLLASRVTSQICGVRHVSTNHKDVNKPGWCRAGPGTWVRLGNHRIYEAPTPLSFFASTQRQVPAWCRKVPVGLVKNTMQSYLRLHSQGWIGYSTCPVEPIPWMRKLEGPGVDALISPISAVFADTNKTVPGL